MSHTWLGCFDLLIGFRHQLQNPGQYSPLEAFYEDKKAVLPPTGNGLVTSCPMWSVASINRCMHPEMKVCKPPEHTLTSLTAPLGELHGTTFSPTADHPPGWLHVSVHPVLRGADHGAVEVCAAPEASPHLLSSACGCGLLQGWARFTSARRR